MLLEIITNIGPEKDPAPVQDLLRAIVLVAEHAQVSIDCVAIRLSAKRDPGESGRYASAVIMPEPDCVFDHIKAYLTGIGNFQDVHIEMQDETPIQYELPDEEYTDCGVLMKQT